MYDNKENVRYFSSEYCCSFVSVSITESSRGRISLHCNHTIHVTSEYLRNKKEAIGDKRSLYTIVQYKTYVITVINDEIMK